ncbi:hypothetical protein KEM55_001023 [Ascosphaera atra]|nr:hypothetical protein KEM55_001023 [Ascosphaera atra]
MAFGLGRTRETHESSADEDDYLTPEQKALGLEKRGRVITRQTKHGRKLVRKSLVDLQRKEYLDRQRREKLETPQTCNEEAMEAMEPEQEEGEQRAETPRLGGFRGFLQRVKR